jgi:hypothetical protein
MALVLTPFRYEYQAQRHCPADTVVWLDFKKSNTISADRSFMAAASTEATCVFRKPAVACTAAHCWGGASALFRLIWIKHAVEIATIQM